MNTEPDRTSVIAGLGMTEIGKVYGRSVSDFASEAVRLAVADAGLRLHDLDGLLVADGVAATPGVRLQRDLGLRDLALVAGVATWGTSACVMIQYAAMAIASGQCQAIACVLADTPLVPNGSAGDNFTAAAAELAPAGWTGVFGASGVVGGNPLIAMNARRHMLTYGTTSEQFGHIAVAQREWALRNPVAQMRKPITLEDHQASRWVCEPFHLLDCCLVTNGGIAVVVTSAALARDLAQPPVHLLGWGQTNRGFFERRDDRFGLISGATIAGPAALDMAGIKLGDVDVVELYDCYTYTVLVTLEDYGFCDKGEGGPFVASGILGPGGTFPLNTGGGQLSGFYFQGMTQVAEAVVQARGQGGDRQVPDHDVVMVGNNGGCLDHHATLVLGSAATR